MTDTPLPALLARVLSRLRRIQPEREDSDTLWRGPYVILGRGRWWPSTFILYRDELFANLEIGWSTCTLSWKTGTDHVAFEGQAGFDVPWQNGPELWRLALEQIEKRLASAIRDPAAYNRRVERLFPLACRTGKLLRKDTWPVKDGLPLSARDDRRLGKALASGASARPWRALSVERYLATAAIGYDAVFPELRPLTPREKHARRADGRHGGMLDLPPRDADAFARWFDSRTWSGTHPFEIVFGHPHGILLWPSRAGSAWRLVLGVDSLGLYVAAARMAIAFGRSRVPFQLQRADEVLAALRGEDWVEIGPRYGQLSLEELRERRPDSVARVRWDAPQRIDAKPSTRRHKSS